MDTKSAYTSSDLEELGQVGRLSFKIGNLESETPT
jgi:hypothetical protein